MRVDVGVAEWRGFAAHVGRPESGIREWLRIRLAYSSDPLQIPCAAHRQCALCLACGVTQSQTLRLCVPKVSTHDSHTSAAHRVRLSVSARPPCVLLCSSPRMSSESQESTGW